MKYKQLLSSRDEMVRRYVGGESLKDIGFRFDVNRDTIRTVLGGDYDRLREQRPNQQGNTRRKHITKEWLYQKYVVDKLVAIECAKLAEVSKHVIDMYLHLYNIEPRNIGKRRVLTSEQVVQIKQMRESGMSFTDIAVVFNVSVRYIYQILRREREKDVQTKVLVEC